MTATMLGIRDLFSGHHIGFAVVAAEARYCSVLFADGGRIVRRFIEASLWPQIELEINDIASGPLPAKSMIARVLTPDAPSDFAVTFVSAQPINDNPLTVTNDLDALLRSTITPRLRQIQVREGEDA